MRNLAVLGILIEEGFLASLGMTVKSVFQQPVRPIPGNFTCRGRRWNCLSVAEWDGSVQGLGAGRAVSETTKYSYFFPFALNFILSLSSVNSMLVFAGISS